MNWGLLQPDIEKAEQEEWEEFVLLKTSTGQIVLE